MADRPILFSAPMVLGLIREARAPGTGKSQTRRLGGVPIIERTEADGWHIHNRWGGIFASSGSDVGAHAADLLPIQPGDRLWVREEWRSSEAYDDLKPSEMGGEEPIQYSADGAVVRWSKGTARPGRRRASMHMPRWASRLTLTVTDVRVQRLQDISEEDAISEGSGLYVPGHGFITEDELRAEPGYSNFLAPRAGFEVIWTEINGLDSWSANPWVAAYSFDVEDRNIDATSSNALRRA